MSTRSRLFKNWDLIDCGSYGRIYAADYPLDGQRYAIKCVRLRRHQKDVLKEVRLLASMDHKNICKYYGSWIDTEVYERFYNRMKYVEFLDDGMITNSDTFVNDNNWVNEELTSNVLCIQMKLYDMNLNTRMETYYSTLDTQQWMVGILSGIKALHSNGYVHGDICPRNILLDLKTNTSVLTDFGTVSDPAPSIYHVPDIHDETFVNDDIYAAFVISIELVYKFKTKTEKLRTLKNAVAFIEQDDSHTKQKYSELVNILMIQFPELLTSKSSPLKTYMIPD